MPYTVHMKVEQKRRINKNTIIVFTNGALVMVVELLASRIITPYVGSSSFVWTAIIGVMLGALALGYAWGGTNADKKHPVPLAFLLITAALLVVLPAVAYETVLQSLSSTFTDIRTLSVMASVLLFAPSVFFMGAVSPTVAKRNITTLQKSGKSVGNVYAYGTVGSIVGTFVCGFWLTNYFSNKHILLGVAATLFLLAMYESLPTLMRSKKVSVGVFLIMLLAFISPPLSSQSLLYQTDTPYAHYEIYDVILRGNKDVRVLATDKMGWQTGITKTDPTEPAFSYMKEFYAIAQQKKDIARALLLGGGAYSLPTIFTAKIPQLKLDVVEIDPQLEALAKDYFWYTPTNNIMTYAMDARVFMAQSTQTYDIIFVDVYSSLRPPFHLTTVEFVRLLQQQLAPNGVIVANVIGALQGQESKFPASQLQTYKQVFEHVGVYQVATENAATEKQNLILLASRLPIDDFTSHNIATLPTNEAIVLRDDYAPTDRLIGY